MATSRPKPHILLNNGDLDTDTRAIWAALADANNPPTLFVWGKTVVRVDHGNNGPELVTLDRDKLRYHIARTVQCTRLDAGGRILIAPPTAMVQNALATPPTEIPLPQLDRITRAPTVAPDGTLQDEAGYYPATRTLYAPDETITWLPVPEHPDATEIRAAVNQLWEPLADFPFVSDSHRAYAIAAMIQPFVRNCIDGATPCYFIEKPSAGSGSSLLSRTIAAPSVGTRYSNISQPGDNEEWRKCLTAVLRKSPDMVIIDNAKTLDGAALAKVLTDHFWTDRELGSSREITVPVTATWIATANNAIIGPDIRRRLMRIRLDTGTPEPWRDDRKFRIPDLTAWNEQNRSLMIQAALMLIRAWFAAGCPGSDRHLAMYENWSNVLGGILHVAGIDGFLDDLYDTDGADDIETDVKHWFIAEWWKAYGNQPVRSSDLRWAYSADSPVSQILSKSAVNDRSAATQFGIWLRQQKDTITEIVDPRESTVRVQLQVVRQRDRVHNAAQYRLEIRRRRVIEAVNWADVLGLSRRSGKSRANTIGVNP